jgi:hypothetical protein
MKRVYIWQGMVMSNNQLKHVSYIINWFQPSCTSTISDNLCTLTSHLISFFLEIFETLSSLVQLQKYNRLHTQG